MNGKTYHLRGQGLDRGQRLRRAPHGPMGERRGARHVRLRSRPENKPREDTDGADGHWHTQGIEGDFGSLFIGDQGCREGSRHIEQIHLPVCLIWKETTAQVVCANLGDVRCRVVTRAGVIYLSEVHTPERMRDQIYLHGR